MGVAVLKGAPKPDISTPDAFKRALLAAKAVAYTDPASGGASGVHMAKVLERLGIASEVKREGEARSAASRSRPSWSRARPTSRSSRCRN